jgi:hypothetical protein
MKTKFDSYDEPDLVIIDDFLLNKENILKWMKSK